MSDPNTPGNDSQNPGGQNPPAGDRPDAQPTVPLQSPSGPQTPVPPQAPAGPQQPYGQQAPAAPQQPYGQQAPAAPQQPYAPGAPGAPGAPQTPGVPSYGYPSAPRQPKGLAITALILGIVAVVGGMIFGWIPFVGGVITILVGIAAVILGFIALNKKQSKGMSLTGLILGGVGVLAGIGVVIAWSVFFANVSSSIDDYSSSLDDLQSELDSMDTPTTESDTDTGMDALEYSSEFCDAFDEFTSISGGTDLSSESTESLKALKNLSEVTSPNQDVYIQMYELVTNPASATSSDDASQLGQDLISAMMEDTAGCM